MKWLEVSIDYGDGSYGVERGRTEKDLISHIESCGEEVGCYPWGDIYEVDSESEGFFVDSAD